MSALPRRPPRFAAVRAQVGPIISFIVLASAIGGLAVRDAAIEHAKAVRTMRSLRVSFPAARLLKARTRFLGPSRAPFTLVEFGDYQCPPCRANRPAVKTAVEEYAPRLRVDFRHYPLTALHPHAMEAAVIAESATDSVRFWRLHDQLMTSDLAVPGAATRLAASLNESTSLARGKVRVERDISLGEAVGVRSTPTFFLCSPKGEVFHLRSLADLSLFLRWPRAGAL